MDSPSISVGICAHNEEETIGDLLDQVSNEDIPTKEIIVVVAGNDNTAKIVSSKSKQNDKIQLIKEAEREGQIAAQNKILSRITGDLVLLLDGDGTIEPGSLEALYQRLNDDNIVAGKEIPETDDTLLGRIISLYGELHHEMCKNNPRFSTHLGLFPSEIIDSFPRIILDDAYVEHKALENNLDIEYVEEAVKHHNTPNRFQFFFHQQRKNWAGRFQANEKGYIHSKSDKLLASVFLKQISNTSIKDLPALVSLGVIEVAAYLSARYKQLKRDFPVKWQRP